MPLGGHPANDLAPKAIMKLILDASAPTPGAVGAHKEHFATACGTRGQQGHPAGGVAKRRMDRKNIRTGTALFHGGRPIKTGELFPEFVIAIFVRVEARQEM